MTAHRDLLPAELMVPAGALPAVPAAPPAEPWLQAPSLIALLQLASPGLPIGAFAYSQGLETAIELGFVTNEADATAWLLGNLEDGVARLDLPLVARLHAAFANGDAQAALAWSELLLACRETSERRQEDRQLGRALARLLVDRGVAAARPFLDSESVTHAAMFALGAARAGAPCEPTLHAFAFAWAESQVSALARLLPLGQLAAQRALSRAAEAVPGAVSLALSLPDSALGSTLPGVAIASALHETQYTRLFKS